MIEPLRTSLVSAILECINLDRMNKGCFVNPEIVRGVIESFVSVNKFKKRNTIEVRTSSDKSVYFFFHNFFNETYILVV